jgi:hypothetical protein
MRFGIGSRRGFGRAAARLARRGRRGRRAALNSKMPTPPKRDTSEAALKKAMAKRYKQSSANKVNAAQAAARNRKNPTRFKSSRPNNMRGVTQGGIPARTPTQDAVAKSSKQIVKQNQPKQQSQPTRYRVRIGTPPIQQPGRFVSPEERAAVMKTLTRKGRKFSEGGSVSRTGHTDYRKKGMFK